VTPKEPHPTRFGQTALSAPQLNAVEAYIQFEPGLITDDGKVTNNETEEFSAQRHGGVPRVHREGQHGVAKDEHGMTMPTQEYAR
jgi:hypothetical protein